MLIRFLSIIIGALLLIIFIVIINVENIVFAA